MGKSADSAPNTNRWQAGPRTSQVVGLSVRRPIGDSREQVDPRSVSGRIFQVTQRRVLKQTTVATAGFLLAYTLAAILVTYTGVGESDTPNLPLVIRIRAVSAVVIAGALAMALRDRAREAGALILVSQSAVVISMAVLGLELGYPAVLGIGVGSVLILEIIVVLVARVRTRLLLSIGALGGFLAGTALVLDRTPTSEKQLILELAAVFLFLLFVVIGPGLAGAYERNTLLASLSSIAYTDPVTGLPNAARLTADLENALSTAHRAEVTYAVFGVRIEGLGRTNRRHGYAEGDHVLYQFGQQLGALRGKYTAYRIPGAMFVLLPTSEWTPHTSDEIIRDLGGVLVAPIRLGDSAVVPKVIVVGTVSPLDGRSAKRLIGNLQNTAARDDSGIGTDVIRWFDAHEYQEMERRYAIEEAIGTALDERQISVVIQPKLDIATGRLHGGEILARWSHAHLGAVAPPDFVRAIEAQGLMIPFTELILEDAARVLGRISGDQKEGFVIAFNLTASALSDPRLFGMLERARRRFAPATLELELTEDVFLLVADEVTQTVEGIKRLGVRLALDDFGTGFSNLGYLQHLRIDTLKIDRRFVTPLPADSNSRSIVRAICSMARGLEIEVVAEGVETAGQLETLREAGCHIVQGYLYARPLDEDAFVQFCRNLPGS